MPSSRPGIVVTTIGRWEWVEELMHSLVGSTLPPHAVLIANQSGQPAPTSISSLAGVEVIRSEGGASAGRNLGIDALVDHTDFLGFPNDHSTLQPETLATVAKYFASADPPGAVAGVLLEPGGPRFVLPSSGTQLDRWRVWLGIEPATFLSPAVSRLRYCEELGPGSPTPWQAGEGTELLMRAMRHNHRVVAAPDVVVCGRGEQRTLTLAEQRIKLRSYARGTGYALRRQNASALESSVYLLSPLVRLVVPPPTRSRPRLVEVVITVAGRVEGRMGRCFGSHDDRLRRGSLLK